MLNQAIVVGKVEGSNNGFVFVKCQRNFRNKEGIFETDNIKIYVPRTFHINFEVNSTIAVKCRMEQKFFDEPLQLIAERISIVDNGIDKVLEV